MSELGLGRRGARGDVAQRVDDGRLGCRAVALWYEPLAAKSQSVPKSEIAAAPSALALRQRRSWCVTHSGDASAHHRCSRPRSSGFGRPCKKDCTR